MNILFLTLVKINSLEERGIYQDLLRKFTEEGHHIMIVSPIERREQKKSHLIVEEKASILKVQTLNLQKTNIIEKGFGTILIESQYLKEIKKHTKNIKFDLVLYSTPPITFSKVIQFVKNRDQAYSYLLLKDIFPQNAVDMKMMKENGILHRYFKKKEKSLYEISDTIGCMSPANKDYVLKHNTYVDATKVEVNPNTISPTIITTTPSQKENIKRKYDLPLDKKILVYGGNLGIPQGIDFLLETIAANNESNAYFLIVGSGTVYDKVCHWFEVRKPKNAMLLSALPKEDYDLLLFACDIGLIFLNKNFTIPNFPSRLLSYLEMKMPVIAATDAATDIGKVIEEANCGKWVLSGDTLAMQNAISTFVELAPDDFEQKRSNAWQLLQDQYLVQYSYDLIVNKLK